MNRIVRRARANPRRRAHLRPGRVGRGAMATLVLFGALASLSCDPGSDEDQTLATTNPTTVIDEGCYSCCEDAGEPVVYRLTELRIPTQDDVDDGGDLGHNLDGQGTLCDTPDFTGGVDNALVDVAATLTTLEEPVDLNHELARALACDGDGCAPLAIEVSVAIGTWCAEVEWRDGLSGDVIGRAATYRLDSGGIRGATAQLDISVPISAGPRCQSGDACDPGGAACADGSPCEERFVQLALTLSSVIVTADVSGEGIRSLVIGGVASQSDLEEWLREGAAPLWSAETTEMVQGIFWGFYDVQLDRTACNGLSVGFTGAADPL